MDTDGIIRESTRESVTYLVTRMGPEYRAAAQAAIEKASKFGVRDIYGDVADDDLIEVFADGECIAVVWG